jgi:hypothetical protein
MKEVLLKELRTLPLPVMRNLACIVLVVSGSRNFFVSGHRKYKSYTKNSLSKHFVC